MHVLSVSQIFYSLDGSVIGGMGPYGVAHVAHKSWLLYHKCALFTDPIIPWRKRADISREGRFKAVISQHRFADCVAVVGGDKVGLEIETGS